MKKKLFTLLTLLLCLCSGAWGQTTVTFTAADMDKDSENLTKGQVTCVSATSKASYQQYKNGTTNVKVDGIQLGNSADNNAPTVASGTGLQFSVPEGYKITNVSIIATTNNDSNTGPLVFLQWTGGFDKTPDSFEQITVPNRGGSSAPAAISPASMVNGARAFGLYKRIKVDDSTNPTEIPTSSGNSYPSSSITSVIFSVEVTYQVASSVTYAITYANGGHGSAPSSTTGATFALPTMDADGDWTNTGWTANQTVKVGGNDVAAGTFIAVGTSVTISQATTFTGVWKKAISPSLSYANNPLVLDIRTTGAPTLTGNTGNGTVTWQSSTPGVAEVDASGNITAKAAGSTTITANIDANGDYKAGSATCKVTVAAAPAGLVDQQLATTSSNTWDSSVIVTSDYTNITGLTALAAQGGLTIDTGNGTTSSDTPLTAKVEASGGTSKDNDKYLEFHFTIAEGKRMRVTGINALVRSVSNDRTYYATLTGTTGSIEKTTTVKENVAAGANIFDGQLYDETFTGTVSFKLWAYSTATRTSNLWYRLGSNIYITGSIEDDAYTAPTITEKNGTVQITSPDEGVVVSQIKYSLDDGTTWNTYSIPFNLSEAKTVKAKVVTGTDLSKSESSVASVECSAIPAALAGSQSITLYADETNFTKSASQTGSSTNDTWTGNSGTYLDGYVIVLDNVGKTGDNIKELSTGSDINSKKTFKGSNGRILTFTLPTGVKVNRITIYSYTNGDDNNHYASGWKFGGTAADMIGLSLRDIEGNAGKSVSNASNPDVRVFSFATPLENTFTFTNSGYQQCFYMVLDYTFPGPTDPVDGESSISLTTTEQMAGWRSFFDATQDYTADDNTTVYVVKAKSGVENQVVLSEYGSQQVPKNHAFILKTSANNRTMTLTKTSGLEFSGDNLLKASTAGQNLASVYRLGANATQVGFFEYSTTSAAAGIVYLDATDVNKSSGARALTITIEGNTTTGINGIEEVAPVTKTRKVVKNGRLVIETANGEFTVSGARVK